ncbi:hypothetical protein HQ590_14055 [bacterium]|nr:hypothetical protein [bacterium]
MSDDQTPVGHTKHGVLSLDQIAGLQPGLGQLMPQVSDRYWILYYAAHGGNWALAEYQLRSLRSLWAKMSLTRPKYRAMLEEYATRIFGPLEQHLRGHDLTAFEKVYHEGIEFANKLHVTTNHPEIVWQLPTTQPLHLKLDGG